MKKFWAVLAPALFLIPAAGYAVSSAELQAKLEKADQAARQNAEQTFNPHLTQAQMTKIPALIRGAAERLKSAGYSHLEETDVAKGLYMYLEINHGLAFSDSMTVNEVEPDGSIVSRTYQIRLSEKGLLRERALKYAFVQLIPADRRGSISYRPSDYPEITNWQEFHNMCQANMNEIYELLEYVQDCDWDDVKEVFCNLM